MFEGKFNTPDQIMIIFNLSLCLRFELNVFK